MNAFKPMDNNSHSFNENVFDTNLSTHPFSYKMIQGVDFYKHVIDYAKQFSNVHWQEANISAIDKAENNLPAYQNNKHVQAIVQWDGGAARGKKVFSSILPIDDLYLISQRNETAPFLWQHFKGQFSGV